MARQSGTAARARRLSVGLTFDTGALIALERRHQRMARVYATAVGDGILITVPAVVIAEWWRGRSDAREMILRGVRVEDTTVAVARLAGEALAAVAGATAIDALVMASAARRGDIVYTSDLADLERLRSYFPAVRLLAV
jgi:predicted nucleic acid-binding protein